MSMAIFYIRYENNRTRNELIGFSAAENYSKSSSLVNKYGPKLRLLEKCLASLGCILMFYGIWFGSTV